MLRAHHLKQAIVRFGLISVQMFAEVATLFLIAPAALSTVHQVGRSSCSPHHWYF
jgi:hypothetical protein